MFLLVGKRWGFVVFFFFVVAVFVCFVFNLKVSINRCLIVNKFKIEK